MASSHATMIADATRQVQIADHLLTMTYPLVKDPKLLMSVAEHLRQAVVHASQAVVDFHISRGEYELTKTAHDSQGKADYLVAAQDLIKTRHPTFSKAQESIEACKELVFILQHYKDAPVAFPRDEKLVIADGEFALKEVTPQALKQMLQSIKQFVASVAKHMMLSDKPIR